MFVRFWDHKNNVVPDSPNHSNMAAVTPECCLSCRRYIKKYSNKTETNVKREINNAYESELRDMTTSYRISIQAAADITRSIQVKLKQTSITLSKK